MCEHDCERDVWVAMPRPMLPAALPLAHHNRTDSCLHTYLLCFLPHRFLRNRDCSQSKKGRAPCHTFYGLKKWVWYLLGYSASKRPEQEFLRYLSGHWAKKIWRHVQLTCCFRTGTSLGEKDFKPRPQNKMLDKYLLGVVVKIFNEQPCPFYTGVPASRTVPEERVFRMWHWSWMLWTSIKQWSATTPHVKRLTYKHIIISSKTHHQQEIWPTYENLN